MSAKIKITKELQQTLIDNESITEVHFDVKGNYWPEAHKLPVSKDNKTISLYGKGMYSHSQVIPGELNVDNITERISKGNPDTKIVITLLREEVLDAEPFEEKENIAARFMSATPEEQKAIFAAMGIDPANIKQTTVVNNSQTPPVEDDEEDI